MATEFISFSCCPFSSFASLLPGSSKKKQTEQRCLLDYLAQVIQVAAFMPFMLLREAFGLFSGTTCFLF